MSLGQGLGQGLMLVAQNVAQNRRANQAQKRQLEMFNLKRVADIEDFQKMEELKDNLTSKKRQRNLTLLEYSLFVAILLSYDDAPVPKCDKTTTSRPVLVRLRETNPSINFKIL